MLPADTVLQNRYRIVRQLGRGGMGTIYEAIDERVKAVVALKEANIVTDEDSRREFEREARLLANLQHPALPKVMDYFIEGSSEYLVMEYVPGYDLAELLERRGAPFHVNLVLRWADELLNVLEYLHGLNPPILHRDIKPANLKLTQREDIYLLDFGLAKGVAGKMTTNLASRSVRGYTPVYASLEQILGQGTDARSDLYSLGATLYHLVTGVHPTDAPTRDEQMEDGKPDPLLPIQKLNGAVPPGVAGVIQQAMAVRRRYRPESAAAMRRALRQAEDEAKRSTQRAATVTQPVGPPVATPTERNAPEYTRTPFHGELNYSGPAIERAASARSKTVIALVAAGILVAAAIVFAIALVRWRGARARRSAETTPTAQRVQPPQSFIEDLNGAQLELMAVPGGTFQMGTSEEDARQAFEEAKRVSADAKIEWLNYEMPQHRVTLTEFYVGKYEVTQAQWRAVAKLPRVDRYLNPNPSNFKGDDLPVENVSWDDAVEFCKRLSRKTGKQYRLPSEAEWEYACRAGTTTPFSFGRSLSSAQANFVGEFPYGGAAKGVNRGKTTPVGSFGPNDFGLYDMHGNVWEWCLDYRHPNYEDAPTDGSAWLNGGDSKYRILRGGSWDYLAFNARSSYRGLIAPYLRSPSVGFRVVFAGRT